MRSFDQVLAEVNKQSDPQRQTVLKQVADLPRQYKAEEAGLKATQSQAFDEILGGARRRGLGFSGIPIGEQAKYTATEFLPAVARLKTSVNDRKTSLESILNDIGRQNYSTAYDIYNTDRSFDENRRRWEIEQANARAAAAAANQTPAWVKALLGNSAADSAQVDPEEAAYQAYVKQQNALDKVKPKNSKGLKVLSGPAGLSIRGRGDIPTGTFTGKVRLPGF